jgi:uncharacterized membrane protein YqhA
MIFKWLFSFRYVAFVAVIGSLAGAMMMFFVGAFKTFQSFKVIFGRFDDVQQDISMLATKYLIGAMDNFLIAVAFLVLAYGIFGLFIEKNILQKDFGSLSWIKINSIKNLKNILAELIIIILFVFFLEVVLQNIDQLDWELLVLPISILLMAGGLKLLQKVEE